MKTAINLNKVFIRKSFHSLRILEVCKLDLNLDFSNKYFKILLDLIN